MSVLAAVWDHAPVARRDVGRLTGLAPSSVTRLARQLAQAGLIEERHTAPSTGGRPPALLSLRDDAGVVIGIDLSGIAMRGAIVTPGGRLLGSRTLAFDGIGEAAVVAQVEALVGALIDDPAAADRLIAIGVSVPGTVDRASGTVLDVSHLQLRGVGLGKRLEQRFGHPAYLEHDTAAAAYAEKRDGAGRGKSHLIFVTVASGIGAGLVLDDGIYRGEAGAAGELGHIVVEVDGPPCVCGKRGCLEAVASAPAFLAAARDLVEEGRAPTLAARFPDGAEALTIDAVMEAAAAEDEAAAALVERQADYLARAIGTVTSLLDIRTVIVGGEQALVGDAVLERVRRALPRYELYSNPVEVVRARLGQDAALRGASALAFRSAFGLTEINGEPRSPLAQAAGTTSPSRRPTSTGAPTTGATTTGASATGATATGPASAPHG